MRLTWNLPQLRPALSKYKIKYMQFLDLIEQKWRGNYVFIHVPKCGGTSITQSIGQRIKNHDTAIERRAKLGADRWEQLYRFSITRHPYERTISLYAFAKQTMFAAQQVGELELNDWVRATLRDRSLSKHVRTRLLMPCFDWLTDEKGKFIVNQTFQLETLREHWPEIQCHTGTSSRLTHANSSGSGLTRNLLDTTSKQILQEHFRRDFETFDYLP